MLKVELKKKKQSEHYRFYAWNSCAPFVDNSRGMLIHRPKSVATFTTQKFPHIGITYLCGGTVCGDKNFTFFDAITEQHKLLCVRCEAEASKLGLPSASELSGKHVHQGKCVPVQVCCNKENENG